jgi:hypothetical protein
MVKVTEGEVDKAAVEVARGVVVAKVKGGGVSKFLEGPADGKVIT